MAEQFRKGIFISYSHDDKVWLDRITEVLQPLIRDEKIVSWDDRQIMPGTKWKKEIETAMASARVAILLVSTSFLASDFIMKEELPVILKRSKKDLIIFWIPISASLYGKTSLKDIQAAHDPDQPLDSLTPAKRKKALVEIAKKIDSAFDMNAVANVFKIVDDFSPHAKDFVEGRKQPSASAPKFSVQARQDGGIIRLETAQGLELDTITMHDLEKLSDKGKQFIRSREHVLEDLFDQSTELYPKQYARDSSVRAKARKEYGNIIKQLCKVLNEILDYLTSIGKHLHDHYNEIRFLCVQSTNLN